MVYKILSIESATSGGRMRDQEATDLRSLNDYVYDVSLSHWLASMMLLLMTLHNQESAQWSLFSS